MEFRIYQDIGNETLSTLVLKEGRRLADGSWHQVDLTLGSDDASLSIDYRRPAYVTLSRISAPSLTLGDDSEVVIGVSYFDSQPGKSNQTKIYTKKKKNINILRL